MKTLFITVFLAFCCTVVTKAQEVDRRNRQGIPSDEYFISLIKLISTPEKYHGKPIKVIGYINLEFEGDALYLHKEDYDNGLTKNGFWVSFSKRINQEDLKNLSKSYVLIEGIFDMHKNGHMGLWSGEIKDITRISKWR